MKPFLYISISLLGCVWALPSLDQPYRQALDVQVPLNPTILQADSKRTVYYELRITNFSSDTVVLRSLDVLDAKDSLRYLPLQGTDFVQRFSLIGTKKEDLKDTYLYPGRLAVLYIELSGLRGETSVFYQVRFPFTHENPGQIRTSSCCPIHLSAQEPVILGNPLRS